ncbi:hypothetical protein TRFO_30965 [Tritrichomonas foetus]|uniref:DnaK protein n=1 Tax=Tritrichomonas foetus TaxID=1144522 RepID=A0A1J4JXK8_9EUKA|nr:hypothetical protein TRFO_30965 [Tritrichomonas foetus]|eukprot:OHT02013.1 hypothetical protein TRFO_30965 [Tritrichomonas foetus]
MMIFLFLVEFSLSLNLAIDFGSYFIKSSTTLISEAPTIALNQQKKRSTPSFLAFRAKPEFDISLKKPLTEEETEYLIPEIGEKAQLILDSKPWMGSGFFTSLIGLSEEDSEEITQNLVVNTTAARLHINDLVPLFLKRYLQDISNKKPIKHITLVFPATYTQHQRQLFEMSLEMCNYKNFTTIDDVDAVIHTYALERSFKFSKKPKTVLFIDVGATSIKGYVVKFEMKSQNEIIQLENNENENNSENKSDSFRDEDGKGNKNGNSNSGQHEKKIWPVATRLSYKIDHKNGGAFVTGSLVNFIKEKLGITKTTGPEERRLFSAAEKVKNQLSKSNSSVVIVQDINGRDFDFTLTKDELDNQFVAASLAQAIVNIAKESSKNLQFDDIELIGGSSRMPIIELALRKSFHINQDSKDPNIKTIGHSLNADEAIAIGAGYFTQQILKVSKFKPVKIIDNATIYSIDMLTNDETIPICKKNRKCISEVNISGDVGTINLVYDDDGLQEGISANSLSYDLEAIKNGTLWFTFSHRPTKLKTLKRCRQMRCKEALFELLNPLPLYYDVVELFIDSNVRKERIEKAHKEIQNYATKVLNEISKNETIRFFTNHTQRLDIIRCVENERNWAKSNPNMSLSVLKQFPSHLKAIKRCIAPVYRRIEENTSFYYDVQDTYLALMAAKQSLFNVKASKLKVDREIVMRLKQVYKKVDQWFNNTIDLNKDIPAYEFRPTRPKEFREKAIELSTEVERFEAHIKAMSQPKGEKLKPDGKSEYQKEKEKLKAEVENMKPQKMNFKFGPKKRKNEDL